MDSGSLESLLHTMHGKTRDPQIEIEILSLLGKPKGSQSFNSPWDAITWLWDFEDKNKHKYSITIK